MFNKHSIEAPISALKASASLFNDQPHYASVRRRPLLFELASLKPEHPLNLEEELLNKFQKIAEKRQINLSTKVQYWTGIPYNLAEVFGTCVQFIDQHTGALPQTTLPPKTDIEKFINEILSSQRPVTVDKQFEMLLNLSGNNLVGAANIGMLATRYMSRFSDIRAYPDITISGITITPQTSDEVISEIMREWNKKVARFDTNSKGKNDGTGDQYYFWTHFFAASITTDETFHEKLFQKIFERGNEIMIFPDFLLLVRT